MSASAFLVVDEQPIFLQQALNYLQTAGKLQPFLLEILRQYTLEQQMRTQAELNVQPEAIEQALIDFRLEHQLTNSEKLQAWLASNGVDYKTFRQQVAWRLTLQHLKTQVSQPRLQEYFIERKLFLDRVVLSHLIVDNRELAEELRQQLEEGAQFEQLAREYSPTENQFNSRITISRAQMPDDFRAAVDAAHPGDLVAPLTISDRWYLFRVEAFLPAALEGELKEQLQTEIFEQWLTAKVQAMTVKLEVNP